MLAQPKLCAPCQRGEPCINASLTAGIGPCRDRLREWEAGYAAGAQGVARRERIATAALQGLLAQPTGDGSWSREGAAKHALMYADALLAELDKVTP